ncbi:MAG: biotin/lipoate A/B protein ligase family protein [Campylobacterota bacterium]|nr:biotin/lipoate A/B protein ligase family protein [Campylobacterota bacterium]
MAADELLINSFKANDLPIFRLYGWHPSLTLGKFSKIDQIIDIEKLNEKNIKIARRITGGGILVHGGDISYSIVMPKNIINTKGVKETYRYLCTFLLQLYKKLCLKSRFAASLDIKDKKSGFCLSGTESYDIIINGKKIGGNAQRHTTKVLLQHGTIPFNLHRELFKNVLLEDEPFKNTTDLKELNALDSYENLKELIKESFSDTFGVRFIDSKLSSDEEKDLKELINNKYSSKSWNLNGKYDN